MRPVIVVERDGQILQRGSDVRLGHPRSLILTLTGPFGGAADAVSRCSVALESCAPGSADVVVSGGLYAADCSLRIFASRPARSLLSYPLTQDFLRTMIGEVFQPAIPRILATHLGAFSLVACAVLILTLTNGVTLSKIGFALFAGAIVLWLIGMCRQGVSGMLIHWDGYGARYLFLPELCIAYALVWVCMKEGVVGAGRGTGLALLCCMLVRVQADVPPDTDSTSVSTIDGVTVCFGCRPL